MRTSRNVIEAPLSPADVADHFCPRCDATLIFLRSAKPHFDSCGFESYSLECKECGAHLAGIIDPCDDELLLTEMAC
jgi:RNase P subunit RPR2